MFSFDVTQAYVYADRPKVVICHPRRLQSESIVPLISNLGGKYIEVKLEVRTGGKYKGRWVAPQAQ